MKMLHRYKDDFNQRELKDAFRAPIRRPSRRCRPYSSPPFVAKHHLCTCKIQGRGFNESGAQRIMTVAAP